jgi:hypothetical protein
MFVEEADFTNLIEHFEFNFQRSSPCKYEGVQSGTEKDLRSIAVILSYFFILQHLLYLNFSKPNSAVVTRRKKPCYI